MTELFLEVVNRSISASWLALAVLMLRFLLKKAPKWVNVLLWGLVAIRLLCPFSLESSLSLIPSTETISPEIMMDATPAINSGIDSVNRVVNPVISEAFAPNPLASANPLQIWIPVGAIFWCIGMAVMALYTLVSYWRIRHRVRMAIRVQENIYFSEFVSSPFVLGIRKPRIYLPYHTEEQDQPYVLAHEQTHIRRKDHWWKPLGFLLLTIHWFNPVMWIAYILLCRDIELACDEKVIRELGTDQRADYSQALLHCSISHRAIAACPLAFGEVGVKERVRNVLSYKKPAFWVVLISVALCISAAIFFLTDPISKEVDPGYDLIRQVVNQEGYTITSQESRKINLVMEQAKLPDDCFTEKGHSFQTNELIPYQAGADNRMYLQHAGLYEADPAYVCFTFAFQTDALEKDRLLIPYRVDVEGNGYVCNVTVNRGEVWDNQKTYPDAAIFQPVTNGEGFSVLVKTEIAQNAGHHIAFMLNDMNLLTYEASQPAAPVSITVDNITSTRATLQFNLEESVEYATLSIGDDYTIETLINGTWISLPTQTDAIFNTIAYEVSDGYRKSIDWEWLYGTLSAGHYRIGKSVTIQHYAPIGQSGLMNEKSTDQHLQIYGEFDIENRDAWGIKLDLFWISAQGITGKFDFANTTADGDYYYAGSTIKTEQDHSVVYSFPIERSAAKEHNLLNNPEFSIIWQTELPAGEYQAHLQILHVSPDGNEETRTCTVHFGITENHEFLTPLTVTQKLSAENLSGLASSLVSGSGYQFHDYMTEELVEILNALGGTDIVVSPGVTPNTTITLTNEDLEIVLSSDGEYVELAFDDAHAARIGNGVWAVKNQALNDFFTMINSHSPETSTYEIYNVAPLDELPSTYSVEEASIDKVVIMVDGDIRYNQEIWKEYLHACTAGAVFTVRVMHYYGPTENREVIKTIYDLTYNGSTYDLRWFEDGTEYTKTYRYLRHFTGQPEAPGAIYDAYEHYVLTDDADASWEELFLSIASSQAGAYIPHHTIYSDLIIYSDYAPIPDAKEITLELEGRAFSMLADTEAVETIEQLFASAEALGYSPATYFPGPQMVFHGKDGSQVTVTLDLESDLFIHDGVFYSYGEPDISDLETLFFLFGMVYWPDTVIENESFQSFFQLFSPVPDEALPGVWRCQLESDGSSMLLKGTNQIQITLHQFGKGLLFTYHNDKTLFRNFSYRIEDGTIHMNFYHDEMYAVPYRIENGCLHLTLENQEVSLFSATEVVNYRNAKQFYTAD